jgi:hypothetical protein
VRFKCTVVDDQHPNGVPFEQWVNAPQQEAPKGGGNLPPPLQAKPVEEPVAWIHKLHYLLGHAENMPSADRALALGWEPLYTAPPRRESQALTKEDVAQNLQSRHDAAKLLEERRQEIAQPPEALRHAQELDRRGLLEEAAELRRLHGLDFALRNCELALQKMATKYMDAVDQRDALLEALKDALFHVANQGDVGVDQWLVCERNARAAIAKAKEQK